MPRLLLLLIGLVVVQLEVGAQIRAAPATDSFYTVSYVEVRSAASSRTAAMAAFGDYNAASSGEDGYVRFELFEEPARPGNFSIIETWRSQAEFDARGTSVQQALLDSLDPIRVSDYDQRPYKLLAVDSAPESAGRDAVYVITHVDVRPSPEVSALLERMAEESRRDAGNLRFDVLLHTMRSNHFTIVEAWQSPAAHQTHVEAGHTRQYRDELGPFLGSPLDQRIYRPAESP